MNSKSIENMIDNYYYNLTIDELKEDYSNFISETIVSVCEDADKYVESLKQKTHMYVDNYDKYEDEVLEYNIIKLMRQSLDPDHVVDKYVDRMYDAAFDKYKEILNHRVKKYDSPKLFDREATALMGVRRSSMIESVWEFTDFYEDAIYDAIMKTIDCSEFNKTIYYNDNVKEALETSDKKLESIPKQSNVKYIDFKDLIKLAESNNYFYERSNGDHRIYKHNSTGKIVVIPYHNLGQGLSFAIQKQIKLNSVA